MGKEGSEIFGSRFFDGKRWVLGIFYFSARRNMPFGGIKKDGAL